MKGLFIRWLILTIAIILTAYLLEGIKVSGFFSAFLGAAMLSILNAFFRPIIILLTLPLNLMTFGFLTFLINALMLKMASSVIPGFEVQGLWSAVFGSLIISVISWFLSSFINEQGRVEYIELRRKRGNRWE